MDPTLSPPAEITAEWTVHAQLTIVRGDPRSKSPNAPENRESVPIRNGCAQHSSPASLDADTSPGAAATTMTSTGVVGNDGPLRVVYKWSTDDLKSACRSSSGDRNGCGLSNVGGEQVSEIRYLIELKIDFIN